MLVLNLAISCSVSQVSRSYHYGYRDVLIYGINKCGANSSSKSVFFFLRDWLNAHLFGRLKWSKYVRIYHKKLWEWYPFQSKRCNRFRFYNSESANAQTYFIKNKVCITVLSDLINCPILSWATSILYTCIVLVLAFGQRVIAANSSGLTAARSATPVP